MGEEKEAYKRRISADGIWYFKEKERLAAFVDSTLEKYKNCEKKGTPFAIFVPNANYSLAGDSYAASYSLIQGETYDTVIVLAPIHRRSFYGLGLTESTGFESPFGEIEIDCQANESLKEFSDDFFVEEEYHRLEYSIELQLPYLVRSLNCSFRLLPILIGEPNTRFTILLSKAIKNLIEKSDKKYLIVAVSNLSSDSSLERALSIDRAFIEMLKDKNPDYLAQQLAMEQVKADGTGAIISLLRLNAALRNREVEVIKYATSAEVTNEPTKTESYLSAVIYE